MLGPLSRTAGLCVLVAALSPTACLGWGNEGHEIVALVAARILAQDDPSTLAKVNSILATDTPTAWQGADIRIAKDIATEATWADVLRENSAKGRELTEQWHFVDIDFDHPDPDKACFGHPAVGAGEVASHAPAQSCVSDKIDQFVSALKNPETPASERLLALKFLLHFVGDIHQPLHAATHIDHERGDRGGNCVGILRGHATEPIKLHAYWDTDLVVGALGSHQEQAVNSVMSLVTAQSKQEWASGKPSQWAQESFKLAKSSAYAGVINKTPVQTDFIFEDHGHPDAKCGPSNVYRIDPSYDEQADKVVAEQLAKAGVRLAWLLSENLR